MPTLRQCIFAALLVALISAPLTASTFIRTGLDELVATNETILIGEVVDVHSYWNSAGTFILSDVRIETSEVLKGRADGERLTITLMGGTVGDLSTLIVGGATLVPGNAYVLFLNHEALPGVDQALTVSGHSQSVFDLVADAEGLRAVSQANTHGLLPDAQGIDSALGGTEGLLLDELVLSINRLTRRAGR